MASSRDELVDKAPFRKPSIVSKEVDKGSDTTESTYLSWWKISVKRQGYRLNDRGVGVEFSVGTDFLPFSAASKPNLGPTQVDPIRWIPGDLSSGVNWPEHETIYSIPSVHCLRKLDS